MKLYHHPLSGHSHRAHLFLSLIGAKVELIEVDLLKGAHKAPEFLAKNPLGQVPVLDDGGVIISDSNGILVYVATKLGRVDWLPTDARTAAEVQRWLSVAAGQIAYGPAAARLITVFGAKYNPEEVIARAHAILTQIDGVLANRQWIANTATPTIADIALFSYIDRAPEGNIDLKGYPNILTWLDRIRALPGFVPFRQAAAGLLAV